MAEEIISVSWSQVKTFQRCPQQWKYKYKDRLQPKEKKRAPYFGSWLHRSLETHYRNGDWKIGYNEYLEEYDKLFDEEKEALNKRNGKNVGPLPEAVKRAVKSYLWYRRGDGWKILGIEQTFDFPIGSFNFKGIRVIVHANGIIDLIIEDEMGTWVVDHKTAGQIPDPSAFHAMDPQLMLYPEWARTKYGRIAGIIYNYVQSKAPSIPQLTKKTGQISKRKIKTDYPTAFRFLKDNGFDPNEFKSFLRPLRRSSPFLKQYRLPRERKVTERIIRDFVATAKEIYKERRKTKHVRNITKDCVTMCPFHDLCRGELNGLDVTHLRKTRFTYREKVEEHGTSPDEGSDSESEEEDEESEVR